MAKLSYKNFQTSEEFEKWQVENPDCTVCTISPIALNGDAFGQHNEASVILTWGCFVVYKREPQN